jgi:hypothetical protein
MLWKVENYMKTLFFLFLNSLCPYVEPQDASDNLEPFEYKPKFVGEDELIDGVPFLKLKDDNIKKFIK